MLDGGVPASHALAERLIAQGYAGMLVPSFRGAVLGHQDLDGEKESDDRNLVLWQWDDMLPSRVRLVDDEGRLASGRSAD